jgi:hypothetical protein
MNNHPRLRLLQALYRIHEQTVADLNPACRKGCSICCTRNVTMTGLEGRLMMGDLDQTGPEASYFSAMRAAAGQTVYRPRITINQLAALCAAGQEIPEEDVHCASGSCPLLTDGLCSVYSVRPFGCRAMLSRVVCTAGGEADMPDFVLSVNTVFQQFIEALNAGGCSGNMLDVLIDLQERSHQNQHKSCCEPVSDPPAGRMLLTNRPIPVLMVPPEHRNRMAPVIAAIGQAIEKHTR